MIIKRIEKRNISCFILLIILLGIPIFYSHGNATEPIKCLTHELLKDYRVTKSLDIMYRPGGFDQVYESEHFKIWYTLTGNDAPELVYELSDTVPDWIIYTSLFLEECWEIEVDYFGYQAPLPDSSSVDDPSDVGGDDRTDVYIQNVTLYGQPAFGLTVPENIIEDGGTRKATAYMKLENDYAEAGFEAYRGRELEALKVTCAHEFFHTIHFSYHFTNSGYSNFKEVYWWYEASAVYMEDKVYDDVNDYVNYLPSFFNYPHYSLRSQRGAHLYGACIFPIFISEYCDSNPGFEFPGITLGDTIIKEIWDTLTIVQHSFRSIDIILQKHHTNMEEIFQAFTVWNLFTGEDASIFYMSLYYSEGDLYPSVAKEEIEFSSLDTIIDVEAATQDSFSCHYFQVNPALTEEGLAVEAEYSSSYEGAFSLVGFGLEETDNYDTMVIYPAEPAEAGIPGVWRFSKIFVIPQLFNPQGDDPTAYFSFEKDETNVVPLPSKTKFGKPFPNPFTLYESEYPWAWIKVAIPFEQSDTTDVSLFIITSSGNLVYSDTQPDLNPGEHHFGIFWDGKNQSGELVSGGIYIYKMVAGGESVTGKIAVIR